MPAKSKAQFRFMAMVKHNPKMQAETGMSAAKAAEFLTTNYGKLPKKVRKKKGKK